jgi:hypothetical protein
MAHHMLDTPRTEAADRTRATLNLDFSEMPSFMPPPGADDLVRAMNARSHGNNPAAGRHASLATPSARAPLAARRNPPARAEFTPLLQSAAKHRLLQRQTQTQTQAARGIATPAALRPGYHMSSPALPEASVLMDSEAASVDQTPMPIAESSIAMSTPIPMMPKRGELGLGTDGANLLTLKEQEAVGFSFGSWAVLTWLLETGEDRQGELRPQAQNPFPRGELAADRTGVQPANAQGKHRSQGEWSAAGA